MKKSILKNVAILTLALFGLGIIGNNVFATFSTGIKVDDQIENRGVTCKCGWIVNRDFCLANGWGSKCTTSENCRDFDHVCMGPGGPQPEKM